MNGTRSNLRNKLVMFPPPSYLNYFNALTIVVLSYHRMKDNMTLLSDWRAKAMLIYSEEGPKNFTPLSRVLNTKVCVDLAHAI